MPMIEKDLADSIVELRLQQSLGHDYCPIQDLIGARETHLRREQWWRRDRWHCPDCRRRWEVAEIAEPVEDGALRIGMSYSEGVSITGPDESRYWRPYRARFIGGFFI